MSVPTPNAPLPNSSGGTQSTVPQTTDIAQWIMFPLLLGCVVNPEAVSTALDSASQLITVVVVLLLVRSGVRYSSRRTCQAVR